MGWKEPRGHTNAFSDLTEPWNKDPEKAFIPVNGGATLETCRPLPPLSLRRKEWEQIGSRMGWTKAPVQLTANEVRLIGMVLAQDNSTLDPGTINRRSFREFDVEFGGRGGRLKCGYSAWLVLAAIRELTAWTNPELALMTDYPTMAVSGDWSGVRDTIPDKLWAILEKHVLPLLK